MHPETTDAQDAVTTDVATDVEIAVRVQEAKELREKEDVNNVNAEES